MKNIDNTCSYDRDLRLAVMDKNDIHTACQIHTEHHLQMEPLELADNMIAFHIESQQIQAQIEEADQRAEDTKVDKVWDEMQNEDDFINDEHLLVIS